jgi:Tfp pilus assembly protein PilN
MIKINLLPQKRAKVRTTVAREPGGKDILIGAGALAGAALAVFLVFDQPKRSKLGDLRDANAQLQSEINSKNDQLKGYDTLKKAADEADERAKSINRLMSAKVVPANVLHELGEIVTANRLPTMTEEMARKTGNGTDSDPNKRFDLAWDPTHVWITSLADNAKDGTFRLEGGAQAQVDIIQLSKRLQASVYFDRVSQLTEERVSDRETGITYYKFVITGKVAY